MKKKITYLFVMVFALLGAINVNAYNTTGLIAPPDNDDCANATTLTVNSDYLCGTVTSGTVSEATDSDASTVFTSDCAGKSAEDDDDVWFKFQATATTHRVSLLNISDGTDMFHAIYSGSCGGLTPIVCSNPDISNPSGLTIGETYFVRVFTNSTANHSTTFDICVGTEPSAPTNDECSNAEDINSIPFSINTDASSTTNNSGNITVTGCGSMNDGVWYKFEGDGNQLNVTVNPDGWDVEIGVYTGSCGSFTCVVNANTGISGTAEAASFVTTLGTDYYINIGNANDTSDAPEGIFTMNVTSTVLSIEDLIAKEFRYYPNPVENTLQLQANEEIRHLAVYNAFGQELRLFSPSKLKTSIDLSGLATGAYFVRAYVGDKVGIFKVIKK